MRFKKSIWSPVEVEYLQKNLEIPMSQLCIALAKTKYAIKQKMIELHSGGTQKPIKQKGLRSRIGKRPDLNNLFLRSSWEANIYRLLIIDPNLKLVEYEPTDFTFWQFGIKKGTVSYTPDFKITYQDGSYQWIEVKGQVKAQDKTKVRRFQKFYPEEAARLVVIVGSDKTQSYRFFESIDIPVLHFYNELNAKYRKEIPHWE